MTTRQTKHVPENVEEMAAVQLNEGDETILLMEGEAMKERERKEEIVSGSGTAARENVVAPTVAVVGTASKSYVVTGDHSNDDDSPKTATAAAASSPLEEENTTAASVVVNVTESNVRPPRFSSNGLPLRE